MWNISSLAVAYEEYLIRVRRYLHQYPELSGQEYKTAEYLYNQLCSFPNLSVFKPCPTGVVAILHGTNPGHVIAARCDIDALPITETDLSAFCSKEEKVMHACGHDGNAAIMLTVAKILAEHPEQVNGTIKFIFQPAEETGQGAQQIVRSGIIDDIDVILAAHVRADTDASMLRVANGATHSAVYGLEIVIHGKGGHGGFPYQCTDTVMVGAEIVCALNSIVAKNLNPLKRAVMTITRFEASHVDNIIPESVTLGGSLRVLDIDVERLLIARIRQICNGIASAYDVTCEININKEYGIVRNHDTITNCVRELIVQSLGSDHVLGDDPVLGGEDFYHYLQICNQSCYFQIGTRGLRDGIEYPHHHSRFCLNESGLRYGVQAWLAVLTGLETTLEQSSPMG